MDLYQLSKTILLLNKTPINRVRFARIIYFTHKELVRKKFMSPEDIAYIRSPLGPIPDGLLRLTLEHPNIIANPASGRPSFAAEEYAINPTNAEETDETLMLEQYREVLEAVERTLKALSLHTTSELVEASHADPSWIHNFNGARFLITPADLKNPFPFATIRIKIRVKPAPTELGALQANLLRGMMQDIVKESTDLEYPDQAESASHKSAPHKKPQGPTKLNPLNVIASLPFLKRPKAAPKTPDKTKLSETTTPSTSSSPQSPTPKPEQNPNKQGKQAQQGTKPPLTNDANRSKTPTSGKPQEGTK